MNLAERQFSTTPGNCLKSQTTKKRSTDHHKATVFHHNFCSKFHFSPAWFYLMVRSLSTALALTFLYLSQKCRKIRPEKFNKAKRKATIQTVFWTMNHGFFFGALEGTRIPGPLIKRIQGASFVKFQKFEETLFLSYHRKTCLCTHRIICIQRNALQPLSSYSGVQKVCKNVQTGKTKPNGQINHRFYGRV